MRAGWVASAGCLQPSTIQRAPHERCEMSTLQERLLVCEPDSNSWNQPALVRGDMVSFRSWGELRFGMVLGAVADSVLSITYTRLLLDNGSQVLITEGCLRLVSSLAQGVPDETR